MSAYPLLIPLFAMIAGIAVSRPWGIIASPALQLGLLAGTGALLFFKSRLPFLAGLACCFFMWGNLAMAPVVSPVAPADSLVRFVGDERMLVEGVIARRPEWSSTGGKISLRGIRIYHRGHVQSTSGRLLLFVGEGAARLNTGDLVRFEAPLSRPRAFGVPGEFDYEWYLALHGISVTAHVSAASDVLLLRAAVANPVQNRLDRIAAELGNRISCMVPADEAAILRALLLGESALVDDPVRRLYSRCGVSHILSISGFHVGTVALFSAMLVCAVGRCFLVVLLHANPHTAGLVLTIPVVLAYVLLSGAAPPTVRSAIMIVAVVVALLLARETDLLHLLMLAALLILAVNPASLFDISFQLSFFAIWGIIVLTPLLLAPFQRLAQRPLYWLLQFFMVSVAATLATLVPVSCHFHQTTLTGLLANFIIVPLMGYGAVVLGFAALPFLVCVPQVAAPLLILAGFLVHLSTELLTLLAPIPLVPVWRATDYDLHLAFLALACITFWRGRWRILSCCGFVVLALLARLLTADTVADQIRLDFFSVGQGESTLVSLPDGRHMLVDGGGSYRQGGFDPGERLLAPALWRRGIARLDYLVLTHSHPDHLQGLLFLVQTFPVGEFWETGYHDNSSAYHRLKALLAAKGVPVRRIGATTGVITVGRVRIEPLAPKVIPSRATERFKGDLNEASLVFRLSSGDYSVLFTGDIGAETEAWLAENQAALQCTVLKVPHHGSRASSSAALLDAAAPRYAVISAGFNNRFHLPTAETLERLRTRHIRVYRTDLAGTITITCAKGGCSCVTFR